MTLHFIKINSTNIHIYKHIIDILFSLNKNKKTKGQYFGTIEISISWTKKIRKCNRIIQPDEIDQSGVFVALEIRSYTGLWFKLEILNCR
jgi:hypothetical protein